MNWLRRVLNHFGLGRSVAKTYDPLLRRADKAIDQIDSLKVVTRREARLRALDLQAESQSGIRRKR